MGGIVDAIFGGGGDDAADAAREGANLQAEAQREALDYLKQTERLPQSYREQALAQLGMLYGLPGLGAVPYGGFAGGAEGNQMMYQPTGEYMMLNPEYTKWMEQYGAEEERQGDYMYGDSGPRSFMDWLRGGIPDKPQQWITASQMPEMPIGMAPGAGEGSFEPMGKQSFIDQLMMDPFFNTLIGQGEDAILRNRAATGGLRSGTTSENLAQNTQNVLRGLYQEQVQGLSGLAGLPSNANNIATMTSNIGTTLGQGHIAAAQAQQAGSQQGFGNLLGLGNLGLAAYGAFSDRRLKDDIEEIGEFNGYKWYSWVWNKAAQKLGLFGVGVGVMADEVDQDAVGSRDGYLTVDYGKLGLGVA